ncbi:MAG: non-hydrolyzing UDP-N-acetylglucosamine 2-epimerase [Fimbriiglobus sp.]
MKKVTVLFGTRPEAIKLAPVVHAFKADQTIHTRVVVTGQHRQMLDSVLEFFKIRPDADLAVMTANQSLSALTSKLLLALDAEFAEHLSDLVLVQGDTTTAFVASLAAFYRKISLGHIEAGLRTRDLFNPWPEEANRSLISRLATLHFAPTEPTRRNLIDEGIHPETIHVVGNTVVDALLLTISQLDQEDSVHSEVIGPFLSSSRLVLITGHRRENFGEGFERICLALADLARSFPEVTFVYPVHLNPSVREPVFRILGDCLLTNMYLIEPLNYLDFITLFRRAELVLSDSGGVQEEALTLRVPVLLLRDTTERPEAVDAGFVTLVGTDPIRIVKEATAHLSGQRPSPEGSNPYGDGHSATTIARICTEFLEG